mgnify:CR=1 FL=1
MITIKVLKSQKEYRDCPIAIRQIEDRFEFITCIKGLIYSSFIVARKGLLKRLFFLDYSKKELEGITNYIMNMATTTIDTVLDGEKTNEQEEPKEEDPEQKQN